MKHFPPGWGDAILQVLDAAPDAMLVVDAAGEIVSANTQAENLFGYKRDYLTSQLVEVLIPESARAQHPHHRDGFFADAHVRPMGAGLELFALRSDGTEFAVEISLSPLVTEAETFVLAAIRDITGRRRSEERFRALLESAPDAMVMVEGSGRIVLVNSQTERLFGYSRTELLGHPVEILIPKRFHQRHSGYRTGFFHDSRVRPMGAGFDLYAVRKNGEEFPVEISLSPMQTEEKLLATAAIRDITDRKQKDAQIYKLNAELEARVAELAATNRELEAFSYSVSHDLRAPLRQIDGFSKILLEETGGTLTPEAQECLQYIRDGTHHMGQLVDGLLNFSRLGRQGLLRQQVDLNEVVREVLSSFEKDTLSRHVSWQIGVMPTCDCDGTLIRQVFQNLFSNALKFTFKCEHATIEVGYEFRDGQSVLYVRDNGVGFDMKYADKLFGVFQRLHLQDEFEGTGVGLATVHRILLKHGGRIWADARPGEGATFFFTLGSNSTIEKAHTVND